MLIACTALALAAPSMRGWSRGARLRNAADEFVSMTRLARTKAVTDAAIYRVQIDRQTGTFKLMVQQGTQFVEVQDGLGRSASRLPDGGSIEISRTVDGGGASAFSAQPPSADGGLYAVNFYPTGRTDPARVRISDGAGHSIDIECASPAEQFRVVLPEAS
jgi:Tfp pilus assembly protein FimT